MRKRELVALARQMRKEPTPSEDMMWEALRDRRFRGAKFRRQQIIDRFIVDFFEPSHRLVIEIDGSVHEGREEHDAVREQYLKDCGLTVLRFSARDVEERLDAVLKEIARHVEPPPPGPLSGKRRGGMGEGEKETMNEKRPRGMEHDDAIHKRAADLSSSPSPRDGEGARG